jgi:hypothetical protein|tara:strand:+ start:6791 stop:7333 length:543 start_codon:yes stop_codon:yes gene_type:complete
MADLKHVGRLKGGEQKVVVVYRTIPGDSKSALVIETAKIGASPHDALMKVVESNEGQTSFELYEVLQRSRLPSGDLMLNSFHTNGFMNKVATTEIEMTPNANTVVQLDELNKIIATQKGVSIEELAVKGTTVEATVPAGTKANLTDNQIAGKMRSDADRFYKEAAKLRKDAEALSPTKKK